MGVAEGKKAASGGKAGGGTPPRRWGMKFALVLGIVKGGALGAAAAWLVPRQPVPVWLLAAALGAAVGLVAGRPFWREGAWVATLLKAIVGFPVGYGAYWLARRFDVIGHPWVWLPVFAIVWALLLEIDDAVGESPGTTKPPAVTPDKPAA